MQRRRFQTSWSQNPFMAPDVPEGPEELVFTRLCLPVLSCRVRSQRISTVFHASFENEISIPFQKAAHTTR